MTQTNPAPPKPMNISMNVRTYIATAVLGGLVSYGYDYKKAAETSVAFADALIAELSKPLKETT